MDKSTSQLTIDYIKDHPSIKSCLKKGLINYSALSRLISRDLNVEKISSKEAILVAARRFREQMRKEENLERGIVSLLSRSEVSIKNKIVVLILKKGLDINLLDRAQNEVRKDSGTFFLLEGSNNWTLITQERYLSIVEPLAHSKIIKKERGLALVAISSSVDIETTPGVVAYLSALFFENGVNILEFLSCWTDTLFIIDSRDVGKTMGFLKF